jgi:uroporphyrin-III C-methyltransferase/precorrin-2 dehydrogenase/sirohydrochlorin ferrochelatase
MVTYNKPKLLRNKPVKRTPRAIDDLAVLPVFYKLQGKKVVLAGGSDAAAWKADLLAASGAIVHVYTEELDPEFDEVLAGPRGASFVYHQRPWANDIFDCAAIAIADAESDGEAQAFYCSAKAAGVPVNVIDKPAYCEFQFGSIVNRSPSIVSISTNGAAPILGQAIRQKIETLLPPSLKYWSQYAQAVRGEVTSTLLPGKQRRAFWERLSMAAFLQPFSKENGQSLLKGMCSILGETECGKVTLVGAGPGDAELLTFKAVRALQAADVILFDDLVSDEVLEFSRREAKKMLVGKRGGRVSCKQDDINEMMVTFAKAGKNVVRLKSGDPVIFGRAGEEITALEAVGIPVSIIPGITSASAMAAQLGVSLTHRDCAQSVRFVTGHARNGKLPDHIKWQAIADPSASTIFYMGGRTACEIQNKLRSEGLKENTPVVICSSVSRENRRHWKGQLSDINIGIEKIGYNEPVLIGIGNVFAAAKQGTSAQDNRDDLSDNTLYGAGTRTRTGTT